MNERLGLLIVLCLAISGTAAAQTSHSVSTSAELRDAIARVVPGDEIVMQNGTWSDIQIQFYADGVVGDSITLRAQTPGQVILDGRSTLKIGGDYLKVDGLRFDGGALTGDHVIQFRRSSSDQANHSRLTNTTVVNYNPPSKATEYKWVSIYGTHNRVDHNYFAGKTHDGATVVVWLNDPPRDQPNHHRIDHNHFGPRPDLGKNGGETIRIGTSSRSMQSSMTVVEDNLFSQADGEIEIISNKTGDNVFRRNTFRASSGTLTLRHGDRATVEGNYFLGEGVSGSGGIRVIGEDHLIINNYFEGLRGSGSRSGISIESGVPNSPLNRYWQVKNALIAFNTFVDVEHPISLGEGASSERSLPPDSVTFANNVILSTGNDDVFSVDAEMTATKWEGNVISASDLGISAPSGVQLMDPMLELDSDGLWRPSNSSPLLDAAVGDYSFVSLDVDGQSRSDGTRDIGADEQSSAAVVSRPLSASDVGPAWLLSSTSTDSEVEIPQYGPTLGVYPNPTAGGASVELEVARSMAIRLDVYDVRGRLVANLVNGVVPAGPQAYRWEGVGLAPGVYILHVQSEAGNRSLPVLKIR